MKKKKIITSIIVGVVGVLAIISIYLINMARHRTEKYDPFNTEKFELKITWKDDEVLYDKQVKFTEGETLYNILERTFGENEGMIVQDDNGYKGILGFVFDGKEYIADWKVDNSYLSLMVNGDYATLGANDLIVEKGMICEFVWMDMGSY